MSDHAISEKNGCDSATTSGGCPIRASCVPRHSIASAIVTPVTNVTTTPCRNHSAHSDGRPSPCARETSTDTGMHSPSPLT
ncbi:MAG: hypothetical protein BWX86_01039 [Verrucomicrobia bacterium ADurb.Bin122]|nr:MAG: hypothetical protein BWX86_01039 [Verrucomicrobia bacterium ADurb.Bin122]